MSFVASFAVAASTEFESTAFAVEETFTDNTVFIGDYTNIALELEEEGATSDYSAAQQTAYEFITAACNEFLTCPKDISTTAFKIIQLESGLTQAEINEIKTDVKASANYKVLDKIGVYSSSPKRNITKSAFGF